MLKYCMFVCMYGGRGVASGDGTSCQPFILKGLKERSPLYYSCKMF